MKERPILFSAPMVLANLAGRKSMTRRVIKNQPSEICGEYYFHHRGKQYKTGCVDPRQDGSTIYPLEMSRFLLTCPYGVPGDLLWVRDTFNWSADDELLPGENHKECPERGGYHADNVVWAADGVREHPEWGKALWRPSIHMPRWASRSLYDVLEVRVERLQDITEADAIAEGVELVDHVNGEPLYRDYFEDGYAWSAVESYKTLWQHLHGFKGPNAWDRNPWVWVVRYAPVSDTIGVGHLDFDRRVMMEP